MMGQKENFSKCIPLYKKRFIDLQEQWPKVKFTHWTKKVYQFSRSAAQQKKVPHNIYKNMQDTYSQSFIFRQQFMTALKGPLRPQGRSMRDLLEKFIFLGHQMKHKQHFTMLKGHQMSHKHHSTPKITTGRVTFGAVMKRCQRENINTDAGTFLCTIFLNKKGGNFENVSEAARIPRCKFKEKWSSRHVFQLHENPGKTGSSFDPCMQLSHNDPKKKSK